MEIGEYGFSARMVVAGYYKHERVISINKKMEVATIDFSRHLKVASFCNMREVAVTDGDRVESRTKIRRELCNYYAP